MTSAIYAGSFDPWSIGHEAILKASLDVFSEVHVLVAVNPSKQGTLGPMARARIIASAIDPCSNWWDQETPFHIDGKIVVATTPGLVVEYAGTHGIRHLVRGLRSTTDFESEFNLYFSNKTIDSRIQTWAVLCPPELLHCSSTYVRSVVGNPAAKKVGTTFVAQCAMLNAPISFGRLFDFILYASTYRFEQEAVDLDIGQLKATLQGLFTTLLRSEEKMRRWLKHEPDLELDVLMSKSKPIIHKAFELHEYPKEIVCSGWLALAQGISEKIQSKKDVSQSLHLLSTLGGSLGRGHIPLFDTSYAEEMNSGS
jgi:pantetheine-phosphate adenylyltransferase